MPKRKKFEIKISVNIPAKLAEFLDELVEAGVAENISQAVRKCIAIAKEYMPEFKIETKREEE